MAVQLRYLRCSLNLISLSFERPMLSRPPDSPSSATRLRDCPALQVSYLSTRDRGAGHEYTRANTTLSRLVGGAGGRAPDRCAVSCPRSLHHSNLDFRHP